VEGLAQELGTSQASMYLLLLAALLGDGSPGEFLEVLGAVITAPGGAESRDRTRGQSLAGAGQTLHQVGVLGKEFLQFRLQPGDHRHHGASLFGQAKHHQGRSLHRGRVPSRRLGLVDLAEPIHSLRGREPAVAVVEILPRDSLDPRPSLQGRPSREEFAGGPLTPVSSPVQGLREVALQQGGQAIGQARAVGRRLTPMLDPQTRCRVRASSGGQARRRSAWVRPNSNSQSASLGSLLAPRLAKASR